MSNETSLYGTKGKTCDCNLCVYSRKVKATIERRDVDELIALVKELHEASYNVGADLDYYKCIMNGSWPSSVQQLERALEKAKKHPNRVLEQDEDSHLPIKVA